MVSWLVRSTPDPSRAGLNPGRGNCVVFLGKTLYFHNASLNQGAQMSSGEFNVGGSPALE